MENEIQSVTLKEVRGICDMLCVRLEERFISGSPTLRGACTQYITTIKNIKKHAYDYLEIYPLHPNAFVIPEKEFLDYSLSVFKEVLLFLGEDEMIKRVEKKESPEKYSNEHVVKTLRRFSWVMVIVTVLNIGTLVVGILYNKGIL